MEMAGPSGLASMLLVLSSGVVSRPGTSQARRTGRPRTPVQVCVSIFVDIVRKVLAYSGRPHSRSTELGFSKIGLTQ